MILVRRIPGALLGLGVGVWLAALACSSSSTTETGAPTSSDGGEGAGDDATGGEDAVVDAAPSCSGDAGDPCANCEQKNCCDERLACLADAACAAARAALDACIASTDAGTAERHECFHTFEGKGTKAKTLHLCGEQYCRFANACAIP